MGTVTAAPTAVSSNSGWANVSGSSIPVSLSDANNGTYITDNIAGSSAAGHVINVQAPATIPVGAAIKRAFPRIYASQVSGADHLRFRIQCPKPGTTDEFLYLGPTISVVPPTGVTTYSGAAGPAYIYSTDPAHPEWNAAYIASHLEVSISANQDTPFTGTDDHRVVKVEVVVDYDEQPAVTGLGFSPADAPSRTNRPNVVWVTDDPEGSAQAARRVVIWNTADVSRPGFPRTDATSFVSAGTTYTAVAWTGTATNPTESVASSQWTPNADLPNGSYSMFVRVADYVGGSVRWQNSSTQLNFTESVDPPAVPTLNTPTWDAVNDRMNLTVSTKNNELTADASDQESDDATSWVANFNASGGVSTVTSGTVAPFAGSRSRRWISGGVSGTDSSVVTGQFYPCLAGSVKSYRVRVRSSASTRSFNLQVQHYDSTGTAVGSTTVSSSVSGGSSGWTLLPLLAVTVPAGATQYKLFVNAVATGVSEANYLDTAGAYPGSTISADTRGGLVQSQRMVIERSTDGGVTYWPLPQCSTTDNGVLVDGSTNQTLATFDLANRHNTPARYRAKTFHNDGLYTYASAYSSVGGPVTPTIDTWNLRDPLDASSSNVGLQIAGNLDGGSTEEMGVFDIQGVAYPGIVSAGVVGTLHWSQVPLVLKSQTAYDLLVALRQRSAIMVMQTDMDGVAYWVRFGPDMSESLIISPDRKTASKRVRMVTIDLYQSAGPVGQPSFFPP